MPRSPLRVLVVAGDRDALALVQRLLAEKGSDSYQIHTALTHNEGLELAEAEALDVCLVDYRLPPRDGIGFITALATHAPGLPPILLTEAEDADADRRGLLAGAVDYLFKAELTAHRLDRAIRYAAEREHRRRAESRLAALLENSHELVTILDRGWNVEHVSASLSHSFGNPSGEDPVNVILDAHDDDRPGVERALELLVSGEAKSSIRFSHRVRHRDGSWRQLDSIATNHLSDPGIRGVVVHSRDITEQTTTRRQVRFQADLLAAVGQAVMAMSLEGRLIYWNAAAEELLGRTGADMRGRPVDELGIPILRSPAGDAIRTALSRGATWHGEVDGRREDGTALSVMLAVSPLTTDDGTVTGLIAVSSDITALKRTEAALRERVKELRVLHEVTRILNDLDRPLEQRLQGIADALPAGWLDPDNTVARLVLEGREYRSPRYRETPWSLTAEVGHGGASRGRVQVTLLDADPEARTDGQFLPEEQTLLENVARLIGDRLRQDRLSQMLARTVAALDEAVFVVYDRTIVDANPAAERTFGYDRDQLLGSDTKLLHIDEESARRFGETSVPILERDGVFHGAYRMRRRDGSTFESEHTVTLLNPAEGITGGAVSVVRDVSDRARKEAELRESEERFRQIAENVGDVFWITDADRTEVEYVSPAFTAIWGRPVSELQEDFNVWVRSILPSDRARVLELVEERRGQGYEVEYQIVRPDGEVRWVFDRAYPLRRGGRVVRIIGVAEDITDRKHAEERFVVLGEEIADGIQVIAPSGTIEFATPSSQAILGFTSEELEGRDVFSLVHPDDRAEVVEMFRAVVAKPGSVTRRQYRGLARDGSIRELESVGRNAIDHPAVRGIIVTTRDVTERNALEAHLRQSQKMEAVGRLAGGIAHDFNNILTVIRSQADLVRMELEGLPGPAPDTLNGELATIADAADRAANLTRQLLAFSRDQILQPRTVDLSDVARDMSKLLARVIGEDITLETGLADSLPAVRVDPTQLENVLMNLAVNARDAMPEGGVLSLRTRLVPSESRAQRAGSMAPPRWLAVNGGAADGRSANGGSADGGSTDGRSADVGSPPGADGDSPWHVALEVADTGTGMDAETLTRCFEPFYTTKEKGKGTGLGLAMAYGFVTQSGGTLSVESEPGRGTRFSLRFPAVAGRPDLVVTRQRTPHRADLRGRRMLVVEDDDAVRRVATRILEQAGMEVVAVSTAESALELLETDTAFHLVLTDLVLPGMTGLQLLDRISLPGHVPVVIMSGYAEEEAHGAASTRDLPETVSFLSKPFTADALVEHVQKIIASGTMQDGRTGQDGRRSRDGRRSQP